MSAAYANAEVLTEKECEEYAEGMCEALPSHPGLRTLFAFSGADEYVPPTVDVPALAQRLVAAAGGAANGAEAVVIADANHNLATPEDTAAAAFIESVCRVLDEAVA